MSRLVTRIAWASAFVVLVVFAVPWFLWGDDRLAFGLPLWLWWHILWMVLASITFWVFVNRAWGLWITGVDSR